MFTRRVKRYVAYGNAIFSLCESDISPMVKRYVADGNVKRRKTNGQTRNKEFSACIRW